MLERYKKRLHLQIKKIEISYKTWKNAREIARAYSQEGPKENTFWDFFKENSRTITLLSVIFLSIIILCIGSWVAFKQIQKHEILSRNIIHKEEKHKVASVYFPRVKVDSVRKIEEKANDSSIKVTAQSSLDNKNEIAQIIKPDSENSVTFFSKLGKFFAQFARPAIDQKQQSVKPMHIASANKTNVSIIKKENTVVDTHAVVTVKKTDSSKISEQKIIKTVVPKADYYILIANKAIRHLFLLHQNGDQNWKIVKQYEIAVGAGLSGPKVSAGDKRTPEGLYFIILRKNKNELTPVYGPLAYILNYPNEEDRKQGKTGQGIWIHGTISDSKPIPTKGCLSLSNIDMVDLSNYLGSGENIPVLIVNDSTNSDPLTIVDFAYIDKKRTEMGNSKVDVFASVNGFLKDWKAAWESRDISRYEQFYAVSNFSSQGMNWNAWKQKKIQTFQAYNSIEVTITKVNISNLSENNAEVKFLQNYKSDQKYFENGKKLFLEKDKNNWKITREITIPKEELLL